jgi:hypothetical protein
LFIQLVGLWEAVQVFEAWTKIGKVSLNQLVRLIACQPEVYLVVKCINLVLPLKRLSIISEGVKKLIYTSVSPRVELEFD